jgi:hypothetical protein
MNVVSCYLVAQCLVRQGKWAEAAKMLGEPILSATRVSRVRTLFNIMALLLADGRGGLVDGRIWLSERRRPIRPRAFRSVARLDRQHRRVRSDEQHRQACTATDIAQRQVLEEEYEVHRSAMCQMSLRRESRSILSSAMWGSCRRHRTPITTPQLLSAVVCPYRIPPLSTDELLSTCTSRLTSLTHVSC